MKDYQRVWAEINLDILASNMKELRKCVNKDTEIMAVIKADAYGHGAIEAAKAFLYNGASRLGVAICDEGVSIRQNNIYVPVLIFGYTPRSKLDDVIKYDLEQTIFNYEMASALSERACVLGKTANIHIKIDTGMGRLGFLPNAKSIEDINNISKLKNINITGIYTHFAESGNVNEEFTKIQFNNFMKFLEKLENANIYIPLKHVANSAAILKGNSYSLNIVRPGIISYGLSPLDDGAKTNLNIKPAIIFKTQVSYVKKLDKGMSVGYGRTFFTKRETIVATIPVGYADGYLRALGNKGRVLINEEYANIIGNICMDQFMVDVTDIPNVSGGTEVILIGHQGDKQITFEEIAHNENTINYEVVCNIGKRVPRVYLKNNQEIKVINMILD